MIFDEYVTWLDQEQEARENIERLRPEVVKALKTLDEMHEKEIELLNQEHARARGEWEKKAVTRVLQACRGKVQKNMVDDILGALKKRERKDGNSSS